MKAAVKDKCPNSLPDIYCPLATLMTLSSMGLSWLGGKLAIFSCRLVKRELSRFQTKAFQAFKKSVPQTYALSEVDSS